MEELRDGVFVVEAGQEKVLYVPREAKKSIENKGDANKSENVEHEVEGLYDSIEVDYQPKDLKIEDNIRELGNGMIVIETVIYHKNEGKPARFVRTYDSKQNTMKLDEAKREKAPTWVEDVEVPLVEGKGIPLTTYINIRQMKKLKIPKTSLNKVILMGVENVETMLFVTRKLLDANTNDFNIIGKEIINIPSMQYVKTIYTQAGYDITEAKVKNGEYGAILFTIRDLKSAHFKITEELMEKYQFNENTQIYVGFEIHLDLKPINN